MTTYSFPDIDPASAVFRSISNTDRFVSSFTGATQTRSRGGHQWYANLSFVGLINSERAEILGLLAKLRGIEHRVTLTVPGLNQRGAFGGTPLVNGANQSGYSLIIDGASLSVTGWILTGDWLSVGDQLNMAAADANSDGSGNVTVTCAHRWRSPANNASVDVTNPSGRFLLANPDAEWAYLPGAVSNLSLEFVEDIA